MRSRLLILTRFGSTPFWRSRLLGRRRTATVAPSRSLSRRFLILVGPVVLRWRGCAWTLVSVTPVVVWRRGCVLWNSAYVTLYVEVSIVEPSELGF